MRLASLTMIALVVALLSPTEAEAEIPGSQFQVGNWKGSGYVNDATGAFSHCVIFASYQSGDTLFFSINADATVSIGVSGPRLNLSPEQSFPVSVFIDRKRPFYGNARAVDESFAILTLNEFDRAMDAIKRGFVMRLVSPVGEGEYSLKDTFRALEATRQCALRNFEYVRRPAAPPAPSFDKTLLFQAATSMITDLGVTQPRYLTEVETDEVFPKNYGNVVLWEAYDGALEGGVVLDNQPPQNLRETDPADIAFLSSDCAGDTATTTRSISESNFDARELRVICVADATRREISLTKSRVGGYVLYTFIAVSGEANSMPGQEQRDDLALSAASFLKAKLSE